MKKVEAPHACFELQGDGRFAQRMVSVVLYHVY